MPVHKLDRISLAKLIAYVGNCVSRQNVDSTDVCVIDDLVSIEVPEQPVGKVSPEAIATMLAAMRDGRKIEAIREHRAMTGYGLKESKDIIEKYIVENKKPETLKNMARTIDAQIRGEHDAPVAPILSGFTTEQLIKVLDFVKSYD